MSGSTERESNQISRLGRSLFIPALLAALTLLLGTMGYYFYLPTVGAFSDATTIQILMEGLFRSLGFLVLSMGTITPVEPLAFVLIMAGRTAGLLFFFYAALTGLILVFADQLRPFRIDLWDTLGNLPGYEERGHLIVCGIGDNGYALATEALAEGRNVVAIDTEDTDRTAALAEQGAITFKGDGTHEELLTGRARLNKASDVFVTTGSDTTNGAIVELIDQYATEVDWSQVIEVTARIENRRLRKSLHSETKDTDGINLQTYGVPEATARELLAANPIDDIVDPEQRIHVWIVGWTQLSKALVDQLLHLMHYPEGIDRKLTIVTDEPTKAEQDIMSTFPGIDPDWWDESVMSDFVDTLFPEIDIRHLPTSDIELLSNRQPLKNTLQDRDRLTIIADDDDVGSLRATLSTWGPKLDQLAQEFDLDAKLAYRSPPEAKWTPSLSNLETTTYTAFRDGCSLSSTRGKKRDRVARQLALVYHVQYADNPEDTLPSSKPMLTDGENDFDAALNWLAGLSEEEREQLALAVWYDLPEYQRESNRHAADHAATKHRIAEVLEGVKSMADQKAIRLLAASEHRRWCAEKILGGWEPLPSNEEERWETDQGEEQLRNQRYHPSIRTVESLRENMEEEWQKDVTQIKSLLDHPYLIQYYNGPEFF